MSERATINQIVQLGVETTPGTSVAANKRLQAVSIEPAIKTSINSFRPLGGKFTTMAALGQEWVEAKVSGQASYTDLAYLLASILSYAAPTLQGTSAYKWTFTPAQNSEDTIKTYTVEHGSSVRAAKFTYGLLRELTMTFNRKECSLSGTMLGQALTDGISMTSGATAIEPVPVMPTQVDVYLDSYGGTLGTTKLTRALSAELAISDRYNTVWALNSAISGFAAHVETAPSATLKLLAEADSSGMAPLTTLRNGSKCWLRIRATGNTISGSDKYQLTLDLCGTVADVGEFSDEDGVYAIEWTFNATHDATWGKAMTAELINTLSGL